MSAAGHSGELLEVKNLRTSFMVEGREIPAVDGVSFEVASGRTLGIVGESGCGKSVTALSIMGLVPQPPGRIAADEIRLEDVNLLSLPQAAMRELRGNRLSMIFQEPMTSLNPAFTIGDQIVEVIERHGSGSRAEAKERAIEMLRRVRIPSPERRYGEVLQRTGGLLQPLARAASAYATLAQGPPPNPWEVAAALGAVWDCPSTMTWSPVGFVCSVRVTVFGARSRVTVVARPPESVTVNVIR